MKVKAQYSIEEMQEAVKQKKTFYQFFKIRRPWRDWSYVGESAYCPVCQQIRRLVIVGMLNNRYTDENWQRCEVCLIKIPSIMAEKLMRFRTRNKISKYQTRLHNSTIRDHHEQT